MHMQTLSAHPIERRSAAERALTKLKSLRLGRLSRLLLHGRELGIKDKIKLNYYPRYHPLQITFDGKPFRIADTGSFVGAYQEIFFDRVYEFAPTTDRPLILDGGANVGLATTFFKYNYPNSQIISFEPDPFIFKMLDQNVASCGLKDVRLVNAALWISNTSLSFVCEGGASGHIATSEESVSTVPIAATRLKSWLHDKVDFLKLDIEGAEPKVLEDCREELTNVENLFVEYHSPANSEQRLARILEILSAAGFRYHIREAFTSPHPFLNRRLLGQMDLQLNIFAFRPSGVP
jgi:FkbM family methyltransferase